MNFPSRVNSFALYMGCGSLPSPRAINALHAACGISHRARGFREPDQPVLLPRRRHALTAVQSDESAALAPDDQFDEHVYDLPGARGQFVPADGVLTGDDAALAGVQECR